MNLQPLADADSDMARIERMVRRQMYGLWGRHKGLRRLSLEVAGDGSIASITPVPTVADQGKDLRRFMEALEKW